MKQLFLIATLALLASCELSVGNKHSAEKKSSQALKPVSRFANVKDPICDMATQNDYTDTILVNGKTYGFCSATCKKTYLENPTKYVVVEK